MNTEGIGKLGTGPVRGVETPGTAKADTDRPVRIDLEQDHQEASGSSDVEHSDG